MTELVNSLRNYKRVDPQFCLLFFFFSLIALMIGIVKEQIPINLFFFFSSICCCCNFNIHMSWLAIHGFPYYRAVITRPFWRFTIILVTYVEDCIMGFQLLMAFFCVFFSYYNHLLNLQGWGSSQHLQKKKVQVIFFLFFGRESLSRTYVICFWVERNFGE